MRAAASGAAQPLLDKIETVLPGRASCSWLGPDICSRLLSRQPGRRAIGAERRKDDRPGNPPP